MVNGTLVVRVSARKVSVMVGDDALEECEVERGERAESGSEMDPDICTMLGGSAGWGLTLLGEMDGAADGGWYSSSLRALSGEAV